MPKKKPLHPSSAVRTRLVQTAFVYPASKLAPRCPVARVGRKCGPEEEQPGSRDQGTHVPRTRSSRRLILFRDRSPLQFPLPRMTFAACGREKEGGKPRGACKFQPLVLSFETVMTGSPVFE